MSLGSELSEAWQGIRRSFDDGRLAHAYIIAGSPRGNGRVFAESMLKLVNCTSQDKPCNECSACTRIEQHIYPDIFWLEPSSKGRFIRVDEVRELINRINQTSYEGEWKACVITYAERLSEQASNAFLKTLEEPPGQSLILLLTAAPQFLLPTIRSRCQLVSLDPDVISGESDAWKEDMMKILKEIAPCDPLESLAFSERIRMLLDGLKEHIRKEVESAQGEDEKKDIENKKKEQLRVEAVIQSRLLEVRAECLKMIYLWHRDLLMCVLDDDETLIHFKNDVGILRKQAASMDIPEGLRRLNEIEIMARRLNRNMPIVAVCNSAMSSEFRRNA